MALSRRDFLKILLVATGGAAAYVGYRGALKASYHWLTVPLLEQTPAGSLGEPALKALLAATEAFVDYPVEESRYADFFRWRSENLPGHKGLYERFAATVNHSARQSLGCDFAECEKARRRKILEPAFQVHRAHGRLDRLRVGVLERKWVLFDLYIVRPIASLFAATDAWRLVGYTAWPGIPRGLERYTQPPSSRVK